MWATTKNDYPLFYNNITFLLKALTITMVCKLIRNNPMEQSPWEANRSSANQEIPHILLNLKFHYHTHNSPPLVPILSQINTVHTLPSYFSKIHFNIILPPTPILPSILLPSGFLSNTLQAFLFSPMPVICPSISSLIWSSTQYFGRSTNHEIPHYAIFCSLLFLTYIHTYKHTYGSIIRWRRHEYEIGHKEERERQKRKKRKMI
jgi:hypothetical protein